jgi:cell division protein FtsB
VKPIADRIVKYLRFTGLFAVVAAVGILMGEKGLMQKRALEEKRSYLRQSNLRLSQEIRGLERTVVMLRSDPKTIETAAKRKLGMARPNETVYLFERSGGAPTDTDSE